MRIGRHTLGGALRERRVKRGLTLPALSAASGISTSYLSDIELGRTLPTLERLDLCAQALGSSVSELLRDLYPWDSNTPPDVAGPPPDGRRSN
jgi:transcriptional regulator with XRE-family HTH domain